MFNDGFVDSDPATVQIHVAFSSATVMTKLQTLVVLISELDSKVFKNASMRNTMINKLNAVIKQVEAGDCDGALDCAPRCAVQGWMS